MPPKGADGLDTIPVLNPTMPTSSSPPTRKAPDHANAPASRKLSAVDQVAAKIRERREREHADNEPPFATLGHG